MFGKLENILKIRKEKMTLNLSFCENKAGKNWSSFSKTFWYLVFWKKKKELSDFEMKTSHFNPELTSILSSETWETSMFPEERRNPKLPKQL